MRAGAVVLAGGRSSRMGQAKALLDWHGHDGRRARGRRSCATVQAVARCASSVRPGRSCRRSTRSSSRIAVAYGGPLAALHTGLVALEGKAARRVFACGVDTPLLGPAFVRAVLRALRDGRRCGRAGDRRPVPAAARRLPRRDRAAGPGAARRRRLRPQGHPGGPAQCARSSEHELLADAELDGGRPAPALGGEREHGGGVGGAPRRGAGSPASGAGTARSVRGATGVSRAPGFRPGASSTSPLSTSTTCRPGRARS